jgi:subtilase family serine protease
LNVHCLESRVLLSAHLVDHAAAHAVHHKAAHDTQHPAATIAHPTVEVFRHHGSSSPNGNGYTPTQIQKAYGFNQVSFPNGPNGTGQTIAIVDAYDDPTIVADLHTFDTAFGLPDPVLTVMSQTGSTTNLPPTDPGPKSDDWEIEESLDVEWAHALAPGAKIVLVEANSAFDSDLYAAVTTAANLPGVSVVSMSWGGDEDSSELSADSTFQTPNGHQGVTFLASTGDFAAPSGYPAFSPNVVAVGGTTATISSGGTLLNETGWSDGGGSVSLFEPQPGYQNGIVTQSKSFRANPDVSFDADPNTGVPIADSFSFGASAPWIQVGGTSFSAPAWGAIIAIANQGRVQNGLGTLDGVSQTLPMLYSLDKSNPADFHDITSGNNGFSAGKGYDLVTGIGSPVVNQLIPGLVGSSPTTDKLAFQQAPTTGGAGAALSTIKVAIEDQNGQVVTTDNSTVAIAVASGPGNFAAGSTLTAQAVNGVATFSNLVLDTLGTYTLQATDGSDTAATSGSITIGAGQASKVVFTQVPATGTAGATLGKVSVAVEDQFGNVVTTDSSSVTIAVASGPGSLSGITSTNAVNGVANFTTLVLSAAGTYTLQATDGSLVGGTSTSISVTGGSALVAPQNVAAVALSSTSAQVSWNLSTGATGYRVFQIISGNPVLVATVSATTTLATISGLTAGSTVAFQVEAFNASSTADSSVASVTLPSSQSLNPPVVTGAALSATTAQLSWLPIGGLQGYRVFYWNGSQQVQLALLGPTATSYRISGLAPGGTYQFLVEAYNGSTIADSDWVIVKLPYSGVGHK